MKIGFSKSEITPPIKMELGGYAGYRPNCGVHDPLYCKAVVLEQDRTRCALIALDLLCADESLCRRIAKAVEKLGIAREHLLVSAIHSHAAPVGLIPGEGPLAKINEAITPENPAFSTYMEQVIGAAAEACAAAVARLEAFTLRAARRPMPPVGSERHTGAPAEGWLTVFQFLTQSGRRLICYSFPCHPTVLSGENLWVSADFAGTIEPLTEADMTVFVNGAAGDISTRFTRRESSFAECRRMGKIAAEAIVSALEGLPFSAPQPMTGHCKTVKLPARESVSEEAAQQQLKDATDAWQKAVSEGRDAAAVRILKSYVEGAGVNLEFARNLAGIRALSLPVTVFRFMGYDFAAVPGEYYSTLVPPGVTALCYTNGYYRYLADTRAYEAGHYEALAAIAAQGGGELLSDTIRQMLDEI